jgi:hypothetical protein
MVAVNAWYGDITPNHPLSTAISIAFTDLSSHHTYLCRTP